MHIDMYKSKYDHRVLGKVLGEMEDLGKEITIQMVDGTSITDPVILVSGDDWIDKCNYIWMSKFHRYYFVKDVIVAPNNLRQVSLHVDVLKSFQSEIENISCVVSRQQNIRNPYAIDEKVVIEQRKSIKTITIGKVGGEFEYHLSCLGG